MFDVVIRICYRFSLLCIVPKFAHLVRVVDVAPRGGAVLINFGGTLPFGGVNFPFSRCHLGDGMPFDDVATLLGLQVEEESLGGSWTFSSPLSRRLVFIRLIQQDSSVLFLVCSSFVRCQVQGLYR